jgi:hypothetical protein
MKGLDPTKYCVMKTWPGPNDPPESLDELDPDTYFVLRASDLAGIAGLSGYRHGLLLMLDTMVMSEKEAEHIQALADDVRELEEQWEKQQRKVPD